MIDLEAVKAACALIHNETSRGTAYLIAPRWAVTCEHVTRGFSRASLQFPARTLGGTVQKTDERMDVALIKLDEELTGVAPLHLDRERPLMDVDCWLYGFPKLEIAKRASAVRTGIRITGSVRDPRARDDRKIAAIAVYSDDTSAGDGAPLGGFSGSPLFVGDKVVGSMRRVLGEDGRSILGQSFACPAEYVLEAIERLPASDQKAIEVAQSKGRTIASIHPGPSKIPADTFFVGRENEQRALRLWSGDPGCRGVVITGAPGMGKSLLASRHLHNVASQWKKSIWLSFLDPQTPGEIFLRILRALSDRRKAPQGTGALPKTRDAVLKLLQDHPTIVVFDNLESLVDLPSGAWLSEYEVVGELIEQLAITEHKSHFVVASQVVPSGLKASIGVDGPVRHWPLEGLSTAEGQRVMKNKDNNLSGTPAAWEGVIEHYRGNPLALNIAASGAREHLESNIDELLQRRDALPFDLDEFDEFLERQFGRLSGPDILCQDVLYWLAIAREPVRDAWLRERIPSHKVNRVLGSLRSLSLIEVTRAGITLVPAMMTFVTGRLLGALHKELTSGSLQLLRTHGLLSSDLKGYVRDVQRRLLLRGLLQRVYENESAAEPLRYLLAKLRDQAKFRGDYAAGNLINLLVEDERRRREGGMGREEDKVFSVGGCDLSDMMIREAHLDDVLVQDLNLSNATLHRCILPEVMGGIYSVCAGSGLVAAGDSLGQIHVWDAETLRKRYTLPASDGGWVWAVAISPCGSYIASGHDDFKVRLWRLESTEPNDPHILGDDQHGHVEPPRTVAFTPDGSLLVSGGADGRIVVWAMPDGSPVRDLPLGTQDPVFSIAAFMQDGRRFLVSGGEDCMVRLWDLDQENGAECTVLGKHDKRVQAVAISNDGAMAATGGQDGALKLWNLRDRSYERTLKHGTGAAPDWIWSVAFSPDNEFIASGGEDENIYLWKRTSDGARRVLSGHAHAIRGVSFLSKGRLVSGSYNQVIKFWDLEADRSGSSCLKTIRGRANQLRSVAFHNDSRRIVYGGSDGVVRVQDLEARDQRPALLVGHRSMIWSVDFHPEGREIASVGDDGTLRLWGAPLPGATDPPFRKTLVGATYRIRFVAFDRHGRWMAYGCNDNFVRILKWPEKLAHRTPHYALKPSQGSWVWCLAFDPEGRFVASVSEDRSVALWSLHDRKKLDEKSVEHGSLYSVCFHPEGEALVTAGTDMTLRLWKVSGSGELQCYQTLTKEAGGHEGWICTVRFSRNGELMASAGSDRTIRLWKWSKSGAERVQVIGINDGGHTNVVRTLAFSPDGKRLASAGDDEVVKIWKIEGESLTFEMDVPMPKAWDGTIIDGIRGLNGPERDALLIMGAREVGRLSDRS